MCKQISIFCDFLLNLVLEELLMSLNTVMHF
jgi:hypothetical protein